MKLDDILFKMGLKFEELTPDEKQTYEKWLKILESRPLNIDDMKDGLEAMKQSVEIELVDTEELSRFIFFRYPNRKQIILKARLKNYMLLESFLNSKDKAKKALESRIESLLA